MDIESLHVGQILSRAAHLFPKNIAIIFEQRKITYAQLNERVNRLANSLMRIGLQKGDKVVILFYNSPQFIESYYAVIKIGAIAVPLNFRLAPPELVDQISSPDAVAFIYDGEFSKTISLIRPQLPKVLWYISCGESTIVDSIDYESLISGSPPREPNTNIEMDDGCDIFYTGGTTGFPKGAYRTHRNVIWVGITSAMAITFGYDDLVLATPPFFHIVSNYLILASFIFGDTVVVTKVFDPVKILEEIQRVKVSILYLVPTMSVVIWNLPDVDKYDLSSIRVYVTGGSPMPPDLKEKIVKHLPRVNLMESYGTTETGWISSHPPYVSLRKSGLGIPPFSMKVRIVDDEGKDVPQGKVGEVIVQGPLVIRGYYKNEEETNKAIKDGWFYTGDSGKCDEHGHIYLVDRKKDMIITGGENVYSVEVEKVISSHPKLLEVAVIGLPHEKWGEQITAVVVLKQGEEMTKEELTDFCRQQLAGYKVPKKVYFLNGPLPKTAFGKTLKRELREQFSK